MGEKTGQQGGAKTLTLIRHAKSSWKDAACDDFDRPLNKRGEGDAPAMGRLLLELGLQPDHWLASPARRARRTAEEMAKAFALPPEAIHWEKEIYEAGSATLLALVRGLPPQCQDVFLIGHNPGFTILANQLGDRPLENLPTCGVYRLLFPVSSWQEIGPGGGRCVFLVTPRGGVERRTAS